MNKLKLFVVLSVLGLLAAGCGGGTSSSNETPTQPVTVSLSESSATVEISTTHQFSATVQNASDSSVEWQVNQVPGGNSTVGTISDSGFYTAPDHVPSPVTVTVTAVSHADATKEASATVTVMSNVAISVSPLSATLEIGKTQQFTATVQNAKDTAVDWQVNNVTSGNSTVGTISDSGLYTAPGQVPSPSTITITAVSRADAAKSASAAVTVTENISISVSPLSATVEISKTYQFSAIVQNTSDDSVDWQVNGVSGGSSTAGTITASGLYTAPNRVPADSTVTIKAIANADPTKEASATVTIMSNVTVSISPTEAAIPAGATQQFTATVQNAKDAAVTWQVNEIAGGNDKLGTITSTGLYTAPSLPPAGGAVTITAISAADSSKTADVNATIQYSNASLKGPYVFSVSGNTLGLGTYYVAGRFVADGEGNIVSGTEDLRQTDGVSAQLSFTGSYGFPSGRPRGTLTLFVEGFTEPVTYRLALTSTGDGPLLRYENSSTGSGQIYKQDQATFSNASMNGSYAFEYIGPAHPRTVASVGLLACDGSGNISAATMDVNDDGTLLTKVPVSGSYSVEATGRTILTLTLSLGTGPATFQWTAYLISTDRAVLTALKGGGGGAGLGMAEKQQLTSFSNTSLSGDFVIFDTSDPATEPNSMLGRFTADGAGTLKAGVADVFADFKNGGILTQDASFTGSYSIPPTDHGRGLLNLITPDGTEGAIFYLVSEKKAFVLGTSTYAADAGQMVAQQGVPFSVSSLKGNFVFSLRGFNPTLEVGILGDFNPDGSGTLSASETVNMGGTLFRLVLTGTYSVGENGRGEVTMTDDGNQFLYTVYVVDSSHAFLLETDASGTATFGSIVGQF